MDLRCTPEEEAFRQEVRAFLKDKLPPALVEKVRTGKRLVKQDYVQWHQILNERGWLASRWPTACGGADWTIAQSFILEVEIALGHAPHIVPFGLSMLGPVLIRGDGIWVLTGAKGVVPNIEAAGHVLVTARMSGDVRSEASIGLFLIAHDASGARRRGYPMIEQMIAAGILALCWEAVGVMDALKDATLDYLSTRKQFGVPIGKFQALQHRLATVALEIEQARSAAIHAADALDGDRHARERAASAAKFTISRVGTLVAEEAIQMHGGIGMTWELPVSHFAKRLTMIGHQLGDEDHHLERFVALARAA